MTDAIDADPVKDLVTLRDWLRWGVTTFEGADLVYGHGTDNAVDEAAFLILSALKLPIDDIGPWLDCRLTHAERRSLHDLLKARVATRKPAPYLIRSAWIAGHKFYVDERTIVPRSYIGELLVRDRLASLIEDPDAISSILELCTGSGCLAVLAAEAFPNAKLTAIDISTDALDVARINVADYALDDRIQLLQSDLYESLPQERFDLIIANPPYVTAQAVDAFPPEYRAEPELAHLGGADGLDLVRRILAQSGDYLTDDGILVVEVGQAREALEADYPDLPFFWLDTQESEGEVFALSARDLAP
ncbi:MAG: 50S ribosomal protein L3 N(5)-glutamine methyltransferase [Hyphomicrobiaceae bacterium]|nr:50S ribosomal protein L3 N(5)-glutamine methyltransferase [Hyphomicrobiaceae bacterium]